MHRDARDPGKKGQLQAVRQEEEQVGGEPLLLRPAVQLRRRQARQAAQVIQASQLQSPGERLGGQIMGLIPPNIKHNYFALSKILSF